MTKDEKEQIKALEKNLESGKLRTQGVKDEAVNQMMMLSNALKASGASDEDIKEILSKAAAGELNADEVKDVINQVAKAGKLTSDEILNLQKSLQDGKLRVSGLTEDKITSLMDLKEALEASGASSDKIKEVLAKAMNQGLTKNEVKEIITKAGNKVSKREAQIT